MTPCQLIKSAKEHAGPTAVQLNVQCQELVGTAGSALCTHAFGNLDVQLRLWQGRAALLSGQPKTYQTL